MVEGFSEPYFRFQDRYQVLRELLEWESVKRMNGVEE